MKYQAIKHNKTGTRLLGLYPTLSGAITCLQARGAGVWKGRSYIGGFPIFMAPDGKRYTIQGGVEMGGRLVVCSIKSEELTAAGI